MPSRRRAPLVALVALVAGITLVPAAHANTPPSVTKTNTIRIPAAGNAPDGTLSTKLTYTSTTASAAASTGTTIGLGQGYVFKLSTCVAYHLLTSAPVSSCADRVVDTRGRSSTLYTNAPSVTLSGRPRPLTTATRGYFTAYVQVIDQTNGASNMAAHSWPSSGLQGAGLPVAALNATSSTLPANSTVTLSDAAYNGQINSGQADSICTAQTVASDGSALPAGVTSSHPAFPAAPAYYEVGLPTGIYADQAPRGVMLVIHGGGWTVNDVGAVQASRGEADRWRARGFETVNVTYRACGLSFVDTAWFHDKARAWFGPAAAICATGISAGGHLALQLAASRPDVFCVDSQAGPTDLRTIQTQLAYDAATGTLNQTLGGRWVHNLAAAAFGEENLASVSPLASVAGPLKNTRVLQGFSADDALVPWQQATDLRDAMLHANGTAYADTVQLAQGPTIAFGHGHVTQAALDDFYARELQLVAPIAAATVPLYRR